MLDQILLLYGIQPAHYQIEPFGDGLINHTWKVRNTAGSYILQQINHTIFQSPFTIDQNISRLGSFLKEQSPEYLFVQPLPALSGETLLQTKQGYFRLFPFIPDSHTINVVSSKEQAFEAAQQFGKFSRLLNNFNTEELAITLPDFHNLDLRYTQFLSACTNAQTERKEKAARCMTTVMENQDIVSTYKAIISSGEIPLRVIHHDTKISNVLFNSQDKGICVIDLDTVMPGYFLSDVGDMMRTYLSASSEEETDYKQITIRTEFLQAIRDGYLREMGQVLTAKEKSCFAYAGKFIIYMQALRFLTDYLQQDRYYGKKYEDHNLNRANNQLTLLKKYQEIESDLNISVI
jgi:Ser/Thr protein kinase RdoA (MazF antagonist)